MLHKQQTKNSFTPKTNDIIYDLIWPIPYTPHMQARPNTQMEIKTVKNRQQNKNHNIHIPKKQGQLFAVDINDDLNTRGS